MDRPGGWQPLIEREVAWKFSEPRECIAQARATKARRRDRAIGITDSCSVTESATRGIGFS